MTGAYKIRKITRPTVRYVELLGVGGQFIMYIQNNIVTKHSNSEHTHLAENTKKLRSFAQANNKFTYSKFVHAVVSFRYVPTNFSVKTHNYITLRYC